MCIFLVDARKFGFSIYIRMWDLVLGFYSKFGVWVMLKMWAWGLFRSLSVDMTQHRSWSATFIPNFDVLYAYLACIQPIFARDSASRGVSLHREGGRNACTWGWMVGVWIWIKKSLHGRNYMLLRSSNLTKWWRANTRLRWWPNRREEFTALSY